MEILIPWLIVLTAVLGAILIYAFVIILFRVINRLAEVNRQLLIVVAGKDDKPESLRALVASSKPPQGKLKGIANGGKKVEKEKPKNIDYTMEIGVK